MSDFEKLINASDLIEWIMETYPDWCVGAIRGIVDHINELPSVEPTKCENCSYYQTEWDTHIQGRHYCAVMDSLMKPNDFCSYGEKQDE